MEPIFLILLISLILSGILIIYLKIRPSNKNSFLYFNYTLFISVLFFIPFSDPLQLPGFFASVILGLEVPSVYGILIGLVVINFSIYGIHIFLSSVRLIKAERYKKNLIFLGQFSRRRHPTFAAYHIIGLSYLILMGSVIGIIIISITMVFLYLNTYRIENNILIPKFGKEYIRYKKKLPRRIYSIDILALVTISYILFVFAIISIHF